MFLEKGQQIKFVSGQFAISASGPGKERCPLVGMALDGCYCGDTGSQTVQATVHYCGGDFMECAIYRKMLMKKKGHILIIDDAPDFRAGIAGILEKAGYKTSEAGAGEEAVELLNAGKQREQYDLFLVDIRMPEGSGIDLVERMRREGIALPTIAVSDCACKGLISELLHKGCSDFLYKPFEPKELVRRVGNLLSNPKNGGWNNGKG